MKSTLLILRGEICGYQRQQNLEEQKTVRIWVVSMVNGGLQLLKDLMFESHIWRPLQTLNFPHCWTTNGI